MVTKLFSSTVIGVALLLAPALDADESQPAEPAAAETAQEAPAASPAPSSLTVAWDAGRQKMFHPDDRGMGWIADEMHRIFTHQAASLEKAGLFKPVKNPDGTMVMRVDPTLFSMSLMGPLDGSSGATCSQIDGHGHDDTVDTAEAPARPRSTPSTEGWVTQ